MRRAERKATKDSEAQRVLGALLATCERIELGIAGLRRLLQSQADAPSRVNAASVPKYHFLTIQGAAKIAGVSRTTMYRMVADRRIRSRRFGVRCVRIPESALEAIRQ
jgi:excisionase family DNA binding protein